MMAVLVTNESGQDYRFSGHSNQKLFPAGTTMLISDEEWNSVITVWRGPGKLNPQPLPVDATIVVPPVTVDPAPGYALALLMDDVGAGVTYIGEADPGTLTSAATWRIKKLTESGDDLVIQWADGVGTFTKEWDERLTYSYS